MENGDKLVDELQAAQLRLMNALQRQGAEPMQMAVSSYINTSLLSARMAALVTYLEEPPDTTCTPAQRIRQLTIESMNRITDQFEAMAAKPKIISANGQHLNG